MPSNNEALCAGQNEGAPFLAYLARGGDSRTSGAKAKNAGIEKSECALLFALFAKAGPVASLSDVPA
jgi:hypothetical protein